MYNFYSYTVPVYSVLELLTPLIEYTCTRKYSSTCTNYFLPGFSIAVKMYHVRKSSVFAVFFYIHVHVCGTFNDVWVVVL